MFPCPSCTARVAAYRRSNDAASEYEMAAGFPYGEEVGSMWRLLHGEPPRPLAEVGLARCGGQAGDIFGIHSLTESFCHM